MFADILAWILIGVMIFWIIGSSVSIFKKVKQKLCSRGLATVEAQNKNTEKECDQSNSSENGSKE